MTLIHERWDLFIDFAATFHETLADVKLELELAARSSDPNPEELEQTIARLQRHWKSLISGLEVFNRVSEIMMQDPHLTKQQVELTSMAIEKIREAATLTDASLRVFFEKTQLVQHMPSRQMSGEELKKT